MKEPFDVHDDWGSRDRVLKHLDKMIASGRVTGGEAERLRSARDQEMFTAAVRDIRARHAEAVVSGLVEDGRLSSNEADAILERIREGDHPAQLRADLAKLRRTGRRAAPAGRPSVERVMHARLR